MTTKRRRIDFSQTPYYLRSCPLEPSEIPHLPPDIFSEIARHVEDHNDCKRWLLVCKTFLEIGIKVWPGSWISSFRIAVIVCREGCSYPYNHVMFLKGYLRRILRAPLDVMISIDLCSLDPVFSPYENDFCGVSLLYLTVMSKCYTMTRMLLEAGSDPNISQPTGGYTPLAVATLNNEPRFVRLLLKYGASPDLSTFIGPPLIIATINRSYEKIKLLLEHGASVNLRDNRGRRAIHYACYEKKLYSLLFQHGAEL